MELSIYKTSIRLLCMTGLLGMTFKGAIAQFTRIETNSNCAIHTLEAFEDSVYALGNNASGLGDNIFGKVGASDAALNQIELPGEYLFYSGFNVLEDGTLFMNTRGFGEHILRSTDFGYSWDTIDSSTTLLSDLSVVNHALMFAPRGLAPWLYTIDSAKTWNEVHYPAFSIDHADHFGDSLWLLGGFRYIAVSHNAGANWNVEYIGGLDKGTFGSTKIFTDQMIYAVGRGTGSVSEVWWSQFSKTENGGESWTNIPLGDSLRIEAIEFTSLSTGYAVGYDFAKPAGVVMATTDSGNTWTSYHTPYNVQLNAIAAHSESLIFVAGDSGVLFKFNPQALGLTDFSEEVSFKAWLHPNPADEMQTINAKGLQDNVIDIKICNLLGKVLYKKTYTANGKEAEITIDTRSLPVGIYIYKVSNSNQQYNLNSLIAR